MIFLPLEGEKAFFSGSFKVPQLQGGTCFGQVPLQHRVLREPEHLNSGDPKFTVGHCGGLSGVSE